MKADERRCRETVRDRSGGLCEICSGRADTMHHRRFRSQGGRWTPSNILHLCGDGTRGDHGMVTNTNGRRREFEDKGWIVRSHHDPSAIPVQYRDYSRPQMLCEDGSIRDATDEELIAFGIPAQFGYPPGDAA